MTTTQKENTISQPARYKVGQKVIVRSEPYSYLSQRAVVTDVEKGEEDWKFYVKFNGRDHSGRDGGLFFAEEMTPA